MEVSFWNDVWRGIVGSIDGTIYWLVELLLQLVLDLSNTRVFSQSVINDFANRIYVILGLVMLFKIIISFIQILINPDKMDDKEQGVGNVLRRVVISLLLIVLVPSIFSLAMQIQQYVVVIIPKAILGTSAGSIESDSDQNEFMSTGGRIMAFYTYTAFFKYSTPECNDGSIYGTGNDPMAVLVYDVGSAVSHIKDPCLSSTGYDGYKYDYGFPLSTIVGIFLIISLVNIAVAVAIRAIKLGICEFIAPIPIASYIDPKTSKQAFDNWVSISIKTYLDLFSRLIILFFTVFIFITITSDETLNTITANLGGDTTRKSLVIAALIVGLLQFAKQAPKFISDMLGVKEGFGDIGGMFKGLKGVTGALGTVGAAIGSGIGNYRYARKNKESVAKALFRGVSGAGAATIRGGLAVANGKGWRGAFSDNIATTTRNSHRRVNKGAIVRQSRKEYTNQMNELNEKKNTLLEKRENLLMNLEAVGDELAAERAAGGEGSLRYNQLMNVYSNLNAKLQEIEGEDGNGGQLADLEAQIKNVPQPITPRRDAVTGAFNRMTGMSSVSGSSLLEASSALSSMRASYYTGEAMKKLSEEGSKLKDTLSMGATYSEVASAYEALRTGQASEVTIGGVKYNQSNSQQLGEVFKKAEKEAAINYINAVSEGKIKNETISEGFKQVYGILDGLGVDSSTKQELINQFQSNPGEFFKSLSDVSKRLETEGKRRQAYEREQKKNN